MDRNLKARFDMDAKRLRWFIADCFKDDHYGDIDKLEVCEDYEGKASVKGPGQLVSFVIGHVAGHGENLLLSVRSSVAAVAAA